MSDRLRRFAAAFGVELRLLCLHWSYLALHVAWAGLLWWGFRHPLATTAHVALEGTLGRIAVPLVSLIALFVGASSASRSMRTRFAAVEEAFPTGGEVPLGRWLAGLVGLMGALVEPLVIAYRCGPPASWLEALPTFLTEAVISFAFTTTLAWVLTQRLRNTRWVYPLLTGFWMACFGAPIAARSVGLRQQEATLLDFMHGHNDYFTELWGRLTWGRLPLWLDLFYVGLTLLLLSLLIAGYKRGRLRRTAPAVLLAMLIGLALAGVSVTAFQTTVASWGRMADADAAYHNAVPMQLSVQSGRPESVQRYDVSADLTDPTHPQFAAKLVLHNRGKAPLDRFALSLNRGLTVTQSSLPVERDGDFLTVRLDRPLGPGESGDLSLRYGGHLFTVQRLYNNVPQAVAVFTTEQGVRLPPTAGWYPLAGRQWLRPDLDTFSPAGVGFQESAAFQLAVRAPAGWGVIANLAPAGDGRFATDRASWAMLFASPRLVTEQVGSVTLAAAPNDLPALRPLVAEYTRAAAYLTRFFPGVKVTGTTLAILDAGYGVPQDTPPAGDQVMAVLDRWAASTFQESDFNAEMAVGDPVLQDLWVMSGGPRVGVVSGQLSEFLWAHYQSHGDAARMRGRIRQPEHNQLAIALCDVYASQGDAGVIRIIEQLRQDALTVDRMNPDSQAAWVKEAAQRAH